MSDETTAKSSDEQSPDPDSKEPPRPFQNNLGVFINRIDSLADHVGLAMAAITQSHKQAQAKLNEFIATSGTPVEGEEGAFTVPVDRFTDFRRLQRGLQRSQLALQSVPRALAVALVSEFDAFMGATLKAFYLLKPEALNATQRTMTFTELASFATIDAAREHILEKEVESFLRSSHSDQFQTLESKLGISLRKELDIWREFAELTKRRNLFVHNDGIVNTQYLHVCKTEGHDCAGVKKGQVLGAPKKYFARAHEVLYELAAKLSHVLWRKVSPDDGEKADGTFVGVIYELLCDKKYRLARTLADFGTTTFKKWRSDYFRRALVVNRAQAYIWDGHRKKGLEILAAEDWSAASAEFQVCVSALRQEFAAAIEHMKALGPATGPKKDGFRDWPVFRELRKTKDFQDAFLKVFGEPFATVTLAPSEGETSLPATESNPSSESKPHSDRLWGGEGGTVL